MTHANTLSSDLAYVRDLAEAGQNAPLLGGRFLAWWGGLMTFAYLGHYLIASGAAGVGMETLWVWWVGITSLGLAGQFLMQKLFPAKPGASSPGNRVQSVLWMSAGFALFAYFAGVFGRVLAFGEGIEGFYWSVPMVIGLYGLGQLVTGLIAGQAALRFAGFAALTGSAAAGLLSGSEYVWLVGAAVAFLAVFAPGVWMLRREPATTV
jgi:cation transport ATPase